MKTHAFVIRSSHLEKAHELIEFDYSFGTWRTSKYGNIILPSRPLQQKENHALKIEPLIVKQWDVPGEYEHNLYV